MNHGPLTSAVIVLGGSAVAGVTYCAATNLFRRADNDPTSTKYWYNAAAMLGLVEAVAAAFVATRECVNMMDVIIGVTEEA